MAFAALHAAALHRLGAGGVLFGDGCGGCCCLGVWPHQVQSILSIWATRKWFTKSIYVQVQFLPVPRSREEEYSYASGTNSAPRKSKKTVLLASKKVDVPSRSRPKIDEFKRPPTIQSNPWTNSQKLPSDGARLFGFPTQEVDWPRPTVLHPGRWPKVFISGSPK